MARLKGHGKIQMADKRRREEDQKEAEKHRQTMFSVDNNGEGDLI